MRMIKQLVAIALLATFTPVMAITWKYDNLNVDKGTCRLAGWSGNEPTSGKLKLHSTYSQDGMTYRVTEIAPGALNGFKTVTQIEIPASIVQIANSETDMMVRGVKNFYGCPALEKFVVAADNEKYASTGAGLLVSKNGMILYKVPQALSVTNGKLTMSSSVEAVAPMAFAGNTTIKTLVLSKKLIDMDEDAGFYEMTSLAEISIASSNTSFKTTDGVLYRGSGKTLFAYPRAKTATSFTVPDGVTKISDRAFANNRNLTTVTLPPSLTKLGVSSFSKARKLSEIKIPAAVTSIGDSAFQRCPRLTKITLGSSAKLPHYFAYDCKSLVQVIGASEAPVEISWRAFTHCTSLVAFPFSAATDMLGDSIFADCGFSSVVFNDDPATEKSRTGFSTFANCKNLKKIDMSAIRCDNPPHSYSIGPGMANGCTSLAIVLLPLRTSFSSTTGYKPTFGENSAVTKIVTGSFITVGSGIIGYLGGVHTPSVFTAVKGRVSAPSIAYTPYAMLFKTMGGARVQPLIYTDLYAPYYDKDYNHGKYVYPGATYYIPGATKANYKEAVEGGCTVKEMFDFAVYGGDGLLTVSCSSTMPSVEITGVSVNRGDVVPVGADGKAVIGVNVSSVETIEVSFTVTDVEMMTVYPADIIQSSGVEDLEVSDEEAATRYYNLQGIETLNPVPGNIYITVRGSRVSKELYR